MFKLLIINPGSTSTKIAIFEDENEVYLKTLKHKSEIISKFDSIMDQLEWRENLIKKEIKKSDYTLDELDTVVARGGAGLDPLIGGTYLIDQDLIRDLRDEKNASHASNLAGIIAFNISKGLNIPSYTVDPISVDEFEEIARLSGLPEMPRKCQSHALNLKSIGRKTAEELKLKFNESNLIGVHLGGGISVAPLKNGRIIDVNNANQGGPYSPERVGTLPSLDLAEYIFENKPDRNKFKKRLLGGGGLNAYLGTNDALVIEKRIDSNDQKAKLVYDGMIYQISKEIGAMATVLKGDVDGIFITGGLANSNYITDRIKKSINFIAEVYVYPGAEEIKNLALGALRILNNEENSLSYNQGKIKNEYDKLFGGSN